MDLYIRIPTKGTQQQQSNRQKNKSDKKGKHDHQQKHQILYYENVPNESK